MKKIITLLLLSVSYMSFSQGEFHFEGQPIGSTFAIDSATSAIDHFAIDLYIVNTGTTNLDISFKRTRKYHKNGWSDQVCDCLICFNATDTYLWSRPANPALSIAPGDSCIFQPKVYPNGINGCSIYSYYVEAQNHMYIDSLDITYTIGGVSCFLNNTKNSIEYSVYPNPANDLLTVNISSENSSIEMFDLVGKKVINQNLNNGKNYLNIENLNAGVYFYTIKNNGNIIETKKLIVK